MMQQLLRWVLFGGVVLAVACGGPSLTSNVAPEEPRTPTWTDAQLEKLEPALRSRVHSGEGQRVAVRVFFLELPTDDELADLLLNRMSGDQAIGEVAPETLQRIAARGDVERIEALRVGYEPL